MSEIPRRDFLKTAAFAAGVTAALTARRVEAGDPSSMNNVPDPLVSGKELATNFGQPAAVFQRFPKKDDFITDGSAKK